MTDEEKELLKTSADAALRPFSNLIEKLFGGVTEELGAMLQDSLRVRRLGRQVKLLGKVQRIISDAGFEPHQIPDNVWMPALSYASMEDSDDLQERWAALLANASRPDGRDWVSPSFSEILHQLSHNEAKFLDAMFDTTVLAIEHSSYGNQKVKLNNVRDTPVGALDNLIGAYAQAGLSKLSAQELMTHFGPANSTDISTDRNSYEMALNNLLRHRLIEVRDHLSLDVKLELGNERQPVRVRPDPPEITNTQTVYITALGFNFINACRKPEPPIN